MCVCVCVYVCVFPLQVQDAVAQAKPPLPAAGAPPGIRRPSAKDDDNRIITYEDTPLGVLQDILTLPKDEASVRDALAPPAPAAADKRAGAPGARAAAGAAAAAGPMPVSGGYIGLFNTGVATVMKDRRVKVCVCSCVSVCVCVHQQV